MGPGRLGLDAAGVLAAFEKTLPQAEWIDVENALCDLRAQKSPAEITVIRYSYQIAEIGLQAALDTIAVGVTEREVAARAQEACYHALRPGIEGREVEAIGRQIVEDGGLGKYFLYSGVHSVGVIEFEPPIFGPSSPAQLKKTMIISVDIPMFNAPWGGLRIEDGYLLTDTGVEKLHTTPYLIQR